MSHSKGNLGPNSLGRRKGEEEWEGGEEEEKEAGKTDYFLLADAWSQPPPGSERFYGLVERLC